MKDCARATERHEASRGRSSKLCKLENDCKLKPHQRHLQCLAHLHLNKIYKRQLTTDTVTIWCALWLWTLADQITCNCALTLK